MSGQEVERPLQCEVTLPNGCALTVVDGDEPTVYEWASASEEGTRCGIQLAYLDQTTRALAGEVLRQARRLAALEKAAGEYREASTELADAIATERYEQHETTSGYLVSDRKLKELKDRRLAAELAFEEKDRALAALLERST